MNSKYNINTKGGLIMFALKKIVGSILLCSFLFNFGIDADLNWVDDNYENK